MTDQGRSPEQQERAWRRLGHSQLHGRSASLRSRAVSLPLWSTEPPVRIGFLHRRFPPLI